MAYHNTTAIIIKKYNVLENDQYVTLYSPEFGKIQAFAKSARKISSNFTGHLEVFNICEIQLYSKGKNNTLTQCQSKKSFKNIRNDLSTISIASIILEIFDYGTKGDEQSFELFQLLQSVLEMLNQEQSIKTHDLLLEYFKIQMLMKSGTLPTISQCHNCHRRWESEEKIHISSEGEMVCFICQNIKKSYKIIPFKIVKLLTFLIKGSLLELPKILVNTNEKELLKDFTTPFLERYLERELYSEKLVAHLAKM